MTGDVVHFERGATFHVTDPRSLFGAGAPVGFNCPGAGCPECQKAIEHVDAPRGVIVRVDRERGIITVEGSQGVKPQPLAKSLALVQGRRAAHIVERPS